MEILLVDDLSEALALMKAVAGSAFANARCTSAGGVAEARQLLVGQRFDLALVDLGLPDGSGLQVIEDIVRLQPHCAAVVATIYDDDHHLFQALQAGAQGYLLKDQRPQWLAQQLRGISEGHPPLSPAIARRLLRHFQQPLTPAVRSEADLTHREKTVLGLLAQGIRIADIGTELGISRHTVGDHVKNIYRKLNISSRAEAALHAKGLGLI
ncbi:MAG: response regulator transcription factor [Rhodoferax sp.]|nr:response regulator transcription factor [Rhodoferax sp.]MCF8208991.1 response regulator transcription factor [Rhodoferax sp.]